MRYDAYGDVRNYGENGYGCCDPVTTPVAKFVEIDRELFLAEVVDYHADRELRDRQDMETINDLFAEAEHEDLGDGQRD